jgi:hypothetical protein
MIEAARSHSDSHLRFDLLPQGACASFPSNGTKLIDVTATSQWLASHKYVVDLE